MNKTMRGITALVGIVLVGLGLYQALVPQQVLEVGPLEVNAKEGFSTESVIIIVLGIVALIASFYRPKN